MNWLWQFLWAVAAAFTGTFAYWTFFGTAAAAA